MNNDIRLLNKAIEVSKQSPDVKKQVGCIIYNPIKGVILSTGYNKPLEVFKNKSINYFSDEKQPYIIHAEAMAINNLPIGTKEHAPNNTLYCTRSCCLDCCKRILETGCITRVVVLGSHQDNGMWLLSEAGIEMEFISEL